MPRCSHHSLQLDVSRHAADVGFVRPPLTKRKAATTPSGRATGDTAAHSRLESLFPGPLVLPGDGLAIDPKEPPQSLRSWIGEKMRNPVTQRRKTIYVVPPPRIPESPGSGFSSFVRGWTVPHALRATRMGECDPPEPEQIREYLEAFYHPLPVKLWPGEVCFVTWDGDEKPKRISSKVSPELEYVGLQMGDGVTRITTRSCPDDVYPKQLSLNDLLDAAIEALPEEAYALVMLTHHDLYEDEDDDFCCGRAYGSSRVSVVSMARYHPVLDASAGNPGIDRTHMWPFSHCRAYIERLCRKYDAEEAGVSAGKKRRKTASQQAVMPDNPATTTEGPMVDVIRAGLAAPNPEIDPAGLWLSRVARTVAHELGHCFCLAHCSYYACVMQGTGGIAEDLRQPPYLCLVCLSKLARAVRDLARDVEERMWLVERYTALTRFCEKWESVAMFAVYRCWLGKRIDVLKAESPARTPAESKR